MGAWRVRSAAGVCLPFGLMLRAGLATRGGPTQIPIAARRGVIRALLFVFAASVAFALLVTGGRGWTLARCCG